MAEKGTDHWHTSNSSKLELIEELDKQAAVNDQNNCWFLGDSRIGKFSYLSIYLFI